MDYPKSIESFPITEYLDKICDSLKNSKCRSLVLTAETGAGKSTVLPLGLLKHFEGKILMTEPRRIAVLGGQTESVLSWKKNVAGLSDIKFIWRARAPLRLGCLL